MKFKSLTKKIIFTIFVGMTSISLPSMSFGATTISGKISYYQLFNSASNLSFRVYLQNVTSACTSGGAFAFMNVGDPNYKVMAAALMSAKVSNSTVTLLTDSVAFGGGTQCAISQVLVQ